MTAERAGALRFTIDYERLPYGGRPIPYAHPDVLYVHARVNGIDAVHPVEARVLELGCAEGGHLIPIAARTPGGRFVGVDASRVQIELASELRDRLGLENVELIAADVRDFEPEGEHDYIICHGVLSWVDETVRERVLELTRRALAPRGVALLSYNVPAGWGVRENLRRVLMRRARDAASAPEAIEHVRGLLNLFATQSFDASPYGQLLSSIASQALTHRDAYLVHEFLSPDNEAFPYSEMHERAARHGLVPIAELTRCTDATVERDVREVFDHITDDPLEREDLVDVLFGRPFRATLFVRADAERKEQRVAFDTCFATRLAPEAAQPSFEPGETEFFSGPRGVRVGVDDALLKAALFVLSTANPGALPFDVVASSALELLRRRRVVNEERGPTEAERDALAADLMELAALDHLEARARAFVPKAVTSTTPRSTTLARLEARTRGYVTDALHRPIRVDRAEASVLALLDGSRDLSTVAAMLDAALRKENIPLRDAEGVPLENDERTAFVERYVRDTVTRFARLGIVD